MKKETYICDCCGKEIDPEKQKYLICKFAEPILKRYNRICIKAGGAQRNIFYEGDFCPECLCELFRDLAQNIEDFIINERHL